jgi:hypothetical protein
MNQDPPHPIHFIPLRLRLRAAAIRSRCLSHQQMLKPAAKLAILVALIGPAGKSGHDAETEAMKTLTMAAVLLALITVPANAQMGGRRHQGDDQKKAEKKPQVDEKAYKAALERIPEPKEKYDPWGVARPADPAKKPK